jgi:hypothetical protein
MGASEGRERGALLLVVAHSGRDWQGQKSDRLLGLVELFPFTRLIGKAITIKPVIRVKLVHCERV